MITVSETSKRDICRHIAIPNSKVAVTPLAPGLGIEPMDSTQAAAILKSDLHLEGPFLLAVGTRWPRKNLALAIDAALGLDARFPHVLAVTGKPGWGSEPDGERIRATGYVSDGYLSALYSAASLYLAPSHYEGFGITIIEAFACGCPAVCSAGGAQPEVAGDAGVVINSWKPEDWTREIESLLENPERLTELRKRGKRRAQGFSWENTAELTAAAYREVIAT